MFTINLPTGYSISYDKLQFISKFPGSMITLALQSEDEVIPLSHPLITPQILEYLRSLLIPYTNYPYCPAPNMIRALDYLGIDGIPDYVTDLEYMNFLRNHPEIMLSAIQDHQRLLTIGIENDFLALAKYALKAIPPSEQDREMYYRLLSFWIHSDIKEEIGLLYIQQRDVPMLEDNGNLNNIIARGYTR